LIFNRATLVTECVTCSIIAYYNIISHWISYFNNLCLCFIFENLDIILGVNVDSSCTVIVKRFLNTQLKFDRPRL